MSPGPRDLDREGAGHDRPGLRIGGIKSTCSRSTDEVPRHAAMAVEIVADSVQFLGAPARDDEPPADAW